MAIDPPQKLPVFTTTAEKIASDLDKLNSHKKEVLDKIVADVSPDQATFANVLEPMLVEQNESDVTKNILQYYQFFSTDAALRDASATAARKESDFEIECMMREDIFKLVDAVFNSRKSQTLTPEQLHILELAHPRYIENGLLLPAGPKREKFEALKKMISQLCIQCQKNLNEEKGGIWFTREELEGAPADDIDIESLEKGTGENEGKLKLTFKYNHSVPFMKNAVHESSRRAYQIAMGNKNNENVPLLKKVVELRDEAARLLGYAHHADSRLKLKMAKNASTVKKFLEDLRSRLSPGGDKEAAHLLEYKKKDCEKRGIPFNGDLFSWDMAYYKRIMMETEYDLDEVAVSQYFPVEPTFDGMLKIFEELLGLTFHNLSKDDMARLSPTGKAEDVTWHDEVRIFSVWDDEASGGKFNGYLFIDLYPRDGKFGHNANFGMEPGFKTKDGRHDVVTALICNFSKPSANKPGLLKHGEVVTMFHELGHGIHDLVSKTDYAYGHGTSVVGDFVEAPSQMLENWCWDSSVLKRLSGHWESKEQIPDELVKKLIATKHINSALFNLRQLQIGIWDLTVHSPASHTEIKNMNLGRLWNELAGQVAKLKGPEAQGEGLEWGNTQATIGHFVGGYDAGYYGYLWSEVFSTDMFASAFEKDPMNGQEGRRYRKAVLQPGGSRDEMESLKEFLGREPSTEAFYKELGLST